MAVSYIQFDALRSLGFGSISGSYAAVGTALTVKPRTICITNNTNGDMIFSNGGSVDHIFLPAGAFRLLDITTNRDATDDTFKMKVGDRLYVKQSTAPSSGSVYFEVTY